MDAAWEGLRLVPALAIIFAAPVVLCHYSQKQICVQTNMDRQLKSKLAGGFTLAAIALLKVALAFLNSKTIEFSPYTEFLAAISLIWILSIEHKHSPSPLTPVSIFLAFEAASTAASCMHAIALTKTPHVASSALATFKFIVSTYVLVLHESSKWESLTTGTSSMLDREQTYGFWSRSFAVSLLSQITRVSKSQPAIIHINRKTPEFMESLRVRRFNTAWERHRRSKFRLLRACAASLKNELGLAIIAYLFTLPFKLAIPFWTEAVILYAQQHSKAYESHTVNNDSQVSLVLGSGVVLIGLLISRAVSRHAASALKLGIRGVIGEAIFAKLQKRSGPEAARHVKFSIISDDMPVIEECAGFLLRLCTSTLEYLFALYFVQKQSKLVAGLLVLHVVILAIPLKGRAVDFAASAAKASELLDERSDAMATTLMSMKGAKTIGCTVVLERIIDKLRAREREAFKKSREVFFAPGVLQVVLNVSSVMYIFASDYFSAKPAVSAASVFKLMMLLVVFFDATSWVLMEVARFTSIGKSMERLQQLLQQNSYELDGHYTAVHDKSAPAVLFRKATLLPEPDGDILLRKVNMAICSGTLTIITGNQKRSVLLQATIGNCTIMNGIVQIEGNSMSYCGNDTWIQRKSIRDNIIGDRRFQENWYQQVIRACCLEHVIRDLPGGSNHVVEATSNRLDPSQLQRLALARTVYSTASIIVLDDVLSYQDAATSATIRNNLFSQGGLLRHGTTVLLATEHWQHFVDMGAQFVRVEINDRVSPTTQTELLTTLAAETPLETDAEVTKQFKRDVFAGSANQLMTRELLSSIRNETPVASQIEQVGIKQYLGKDGLKIFSLALAGLLLFSILESMEGVMILDWVRSERPSTSMYLVLGLSSAAVAGPLHATFLWCLYMSIGQKTVNDVHERLTRTVFSQADEGRAPHGFFKNENIERAIRLACEGFKTLNNETPRRLFLAVYSPLTLVVTVYIATFPSLSLFLLSITLGGVILYAFHIWQYPIWHAVIRKDSEARRAVQKHYIETGTGSAHIRALGWETSHAVQSQRHIDYYQQTSTRVDSLERGILLFCDLFRLSAVAVSVFAGLHFHVDPARLGLAIHFAFTSAWLIENFLNYTNVLRNDLAILKEVEDFIETTPQEEERTVSPLPDRLEVNGEISFQDASFSYESTGEPTVSDVNLNIPTGMRLGVHGAGQCGKSALFLALCGVLPYTGSITIDGREIRNIPQTRLADIITVVPEKPVVIPGATVLQMLFPPDLLKPGRLKPHMEVIELLIYRLGLEDMIRDVGGLNGKFEDLYLTSDQMHVFSLARALVKWTFHRSSVFIIDDIMSKVSLETYNLMSELMTSLFRPATNTAIMLFDNHLFPMLEPTRFARIEGGRVEELDLTNAAENSE